jgi:hypothetical protein
MEENDIPRLFSPGVGKRGMTPAHFAAYCGDRNALIAALAQFPDINLRDTYRGYTPLHWLCDMALLGAQGLKCYRFFLVPVRTSISKAAMV